MIDYKIEEIRESVWMCSGDGIGVVSSHSPSEAYRIWFEMVGIKNG